MHDSISSDRSSGTLDRSLVAYAFLAQANRSEGDLLAGLAPIIKPIAKRFSGKIFAPSEFADALSGMYGLKINSWAIEELAPKLATAGFLKRAAVVEGVHQYFYAETTEEYDDISAEDISRVTQAFVRFASPILRSHKRPQDPASLEEVFLRQLINMEFVGVLLKPEHSADGRLKECAPLQAIEGEQQRTQEVEARSQTDILCAAFILEMYHKDRTLYELIIRLATAALIAEVVLNFQSPDTNISLDRLTIILDTPFLMAALDISAEESHGVASDICAQLQEKGARLAVFEHSVEELKGNLKAVITATEAGEGYGATARRLQNQRFRTYAMALMRSPEARLKQDSISVIKGPRGATGHQHFTEEDEREFERSLGSDQNKKLRRERDAASVAAVMRLRMGLRAKMNSFQKAQYLFLTSNPWLVERSQDFLKKKHLYGDGEVPPAVTDRNMAGLLWVLYGGKSVELPQRVLLANCAKAIEPRGDMIQQMHRFLADIDGPQAKYFRALMTEERAGQYLMQVTLGESSFITNETAPAILEEMKSSLIEELETESQERLARIDREYQEKLRAKSDAEEELREELRNSSIRQAEEGNKAREALTTVGILRGEVDAERKARLADRKRLADTCVRTALGFTKWVHFAAGTTIGVISAGIAWYGVDTAGNIYLKGGSACGVGLLAFLGFWRVPEYLMASSMEKLRLWAYRRELRKLGLENEKDLLNVDWQAQCTRIAGTEMTSMTGAGT